MIRYMNHGLSAICAIALLAACSAAPVSESNAATIDGIDIPANAVVSEGVPPDAPPVPVAAIPTDDPLKLVEALYAGHPWSAFPPGGLDIWDEDLAIGSAARPEDNRGVPLLYDADFMVAGVKGPITNLRIKNGDATEAERQIIVTFDSGTQKGVTLYYGTVLTNEGWQISNVWRDDGWYLSDAIQAELIHD